MPAGGLFLKRNVAGESLSGLGTDGQVGAAVIGHKAPPRSSIRRSCIIREYCDRHFDTRPGARDHISPPFRVSRIGQRRNEDQREGDSHAACMKTISGLTAMYAVVRTLACFLGMERMLSDQALKQGHLGDALAHTGDEGRSTLR